MAVEQFKQLLLMANDSSRYDPVKIYRHARKFNPYLQPEHQKVTCDNEQHRSELIKLARSLMESHRGKVVYAKVLHGNKEDKSLIYAPVYLRGFDPKKRHCIRITKTPDEKIIKYLGSSVTPDNILTELPNSYVPGVGLWEGKFVEKGGLWDYTDPKNIFNG